MTDFTPTRNPHRYLLELGRGGMGTVYLAVSRGPGGFSKLKVVKVLNPELANEGQFLRMFLNEARLSARLNHPNIVQTNEVGATGDDYFIEMEYLDGQAYSTAVRRAEKAKASIPLDVHVWILTQVLAGLHYAHDLRGPTDEALEIVHRDVSPHNVFVTYDGQVKVLDFGIAKAADVQGETRTGAIKGKARYMSPEQATRKPLDRRADVFAVGIMLWEAVCGRRMWEGLDDIEVFLELKADRIPRADTFRPDIPPAIADILARSLAISLDERYPTAEAMQLELEAYLEKTGSRMGGRGVSKLMGDLFAERRVAVKKAIDQQLAALEEAHRQGNEERTIVPQLRENAGFQATKTGESKVASMRGGPESVSRSAVAKTPTQGSAGATSTPEEVDNGRTRTGTAVSSDVPPWRVRYGSVAIGAGLLACAVVGTIGWRAMNREKTPVAPSASASANALCSTNAACTTKLGKTAVCRAQGCVEVETIDCRFVGDADALANPDTLWLGTMCPMTGPAADEIGKPNERGIELALKDVKETTRGLPTPDGLGTPRPIALVACDDARDEKAVRTHLVDDLHVPVVFGFSTIIDAAPTYFIPKRTMAVAVMNSSPKLSTIPNPPNTPRLLWRTALSEGFIAESLSRIVPQIVEPQLRSTGTLKAKDSVRVAVVRMDDALDVGQVFVDALRFNGKPALENGEDFGEFVVGADDIAGHDAALVKELIALAPQVILFEYEPTVLRRVFMPLEQQWPNNLPRPLYFSTNNPGGPDFDAVVAKMPSFRSRFFGAYAPLNTPTNLHFTMRYNEGEAPGKKTDYSMVPGSSYDAAYAVVYAAFRASLDGAPLTSLSLAQAMSDLSAGTPISVGPADLLRGMAALRQDRHIDLVGTATSMNFNPATGDVVTDLSVQCERWSARMHANEPVNTTLHYSAARKRWEGTAECPTQ